MFTFDSYIDAIQGAKKTFVETYVKDDKFKAELNKLVDAQTSLNKTTVKCTGPGVQNIIAEIYCTTSAIGGIYINFINAQ